MIISSEKCNGIAIWEYAGSKIAVFDYLRNRSFSRIEAFFNTHFNIDKSVKHYVDNEGVLATISVLDIEKCRDYIPEVDGLRGEHFIIRNSKTEKFRLSATEINTGEYTVIKYDDSNTILAICGKYIRAFISEESEVAVIELIRDLVMKDQENRGNLFLHAAAVEKDGLAYVICGVGGAGKTTTLLELINHQDYSFLSGDKVLFLCEDKRIHAMGWPDYPNLGIGTIRRWEQLTQIAPPDISSREATDKVLLDFERFYKIDKMKPYKGNAEIGGFLFPQIIHGSKDTLIERLDDITDYLASNFVYKEDYDQREWQKVVIARYDRDKSTKTIIDCLKGFKAVRVVGNISEIEVASRLS